MHGRRQPGRKQVHTRRSRAGNGAAAHAAPTGLTKLGNPLTYSNDISLDRKSKLATLRRIGVPLGRTGGMRPH